MKHIKVTKKMKQEAEEYSTLSREHTARGNDFYEGGANNASIKMYEGKIGEKALKWWLNKEDILYQEDTTSHKNADEYDFLISNFKIDVKTRTRDFHIRTAEMVEQFQKRPKDIYVAAHYHKKTDIVDLIGVISSDKLLRLGKLKT